MNKVWKVTIKYTAKGTDAWGRSIDGQSKIWWTEIDSKSERIAKSKGKLVFEACGEFVQCAKINSVRAAFVREY